jgi:hypothetical protein
VAMTRRCDVSDPLITDLARLLMKYFSTRGGDDLLTFEEVNRFFFLLSTPRSEHPLACFRPS